MSYRREFSRAPSLISDRKKNRREARKSRTMPGNSEVKKEERGSGVLAGGWRGGRGPPPTPENILPSGEANWPGKKSLRRLHTGQDTRAGIGVRVWERLA